MGGGGSVKGLISFSLFGGGAKYCSGLVSSILQARRTFQGWDVRVYIEEGHFLADKLTELGVDVALRAPVEGAGAMFWRFEALSDTRYTHVLTRDADSQLSERDSRFVSEWVESGKPFHRIRDNDWHLGIPFMGGMFGAMPAYASSFKRPSDLRDKAYGMDEAWLAGEMSSIPEGDIFTSEGDRPHYGFVGEQLPVRVYGDSRVVLASVAHYSQRRLGFLESYYSHMSALGECEVTLGKDSSEMVVPDSFDHHSSTPHYYLATQTHIGILERAILDELEHLFIFEDDARFDDSTLESLGRALSVLPEDAKGLWLGGYGGSEEVVPDILDRAKGLLGSHAYYLNREGMRDLFHWLKRWPHMVVDQVYNGRHHDIPNYYVLPEGKRVGLCPKAKQWGADS